MSTNKEEGEIDITQEIVDPDLKKEDEGPENEGVKEGVKEVEVIEEVPSEFSITLKLGDIIQIVAPNNEILNNKTFMIEYIDANKIKLVNTYNFQKSLNLL